MCLAFVQFVCVCVTVWLLILLCYFIPVCRLLISAAVICVQHLCELSIDLPSLRLYISDCFLCLAFSCMLLMYVVVRYEYSCLSDTYFPHGCCSCFSPHVMIVRTVYRLTGCLLVSSREQYCVLASGRQT